MEKAVTCYLMGRNELVTGKMENGYHGRMMEIILNSKMI